MADNTRTLRDEDESYPDWIEISNTGNTAVNLSGYSLTDTANNLKKWTFPSTNINAGGTLLVFASGKDRRIPGQPLHTNFKLDAAGEYLALVDSSGSILTQFAPTFPPQLPDVSFGFGLFATNTDLIGDRAAVRVLVPSVSNGGSTLDYSWTGLTNHEPFDDSTWRTGITGVGFSTETLPTAAPSLVARFNFDAAPVGNVIVDSKPYGTPHNGLDNGATWVGSSSDGSKISRNGVMQFSAANASQITLADNADFDTTRGTITFWMRSAGVSGAGNYGAMLMDRRTSQGDVIVQEDDGKIFIQPEQMYGASSAFSVSDGAWHHIAYVYDQSAIGYISVYIDGVLDLTHLNPRAWSWPAGQQIELGVSHDPFWRKYNGLLDDFRIYNRILTATEIAAIYAQDNSVPASDIGLNIQPEMLNSNASAFLRVGFIVPNPTAFSQLVLQLQYNDGFIAWLNGVEVGRDNAPVSLSWNSSATNSHAAGSPQTILLSTPGTLLHHGTNILAIQGLNLSAADGNFLILPKLSGWGPALASTNPVYFVVPTPGEPNLGGAAVAGPGIMMVSHFPNVPLATDNLLVTARVFFTTYPISNVSLTYRVMYGPELTVPMFDDGVHGDGVADDGIFGARIPPGIAADGQMLRYFVTASDVRSNVTRWPLFTDPSTTPQYLGTVVNPNYVTSSPPVFHLFIDPANQTAADSQSGSRCSLFYDGEFYDNVEINLRGNTTAQYTKKSHHLNFNSEHPFRHPGPGGRIKHTSLLAEFIDPAYSRSYLSYWLQAQAGHNAPFHYPVRVQNNGRFYQFDFHSEVLGPEQLKRFGFDPNGALYKACGSIAVSPCSTGGGPEKKTRLWEPGMADYTALASAMADSVPLGQRLTNLCDIVDLPDVINYMAVTRITGEEDDIWANMSLYRDSDGDQLWRIIPFDLNLSWGQLFGQPTIQATNDAYRSHPFYGSSTADTGGGGCGGYNHLYDSIIRIPETRQMLLRRLRSLMDRFLQPPGLPPDQLVIETELARMTNLFWNEAQLDRQTWGWPWNGAPYNWGPNLWLTNGVDGLVALYNNPRRVHLFATHCVTNTAKPVGLTVRDNAGIPLSQPTNSPVLIAGFDYNPSSGNQLEEFVSLTNPNPYAVDLSNWKLEGGVRFTFPSGTVMPANHLLYVSPNVAAFRQRAVGPHGGQALFVVGPYAGQLNAWGETVSVLNDTGQLVSTNGFAPDPSPAQRYLRITEIMYNPAPMPALSSDPQQFEYLKFKNISTNLTLDLSGVRLTAGVSFSFTGSAVSHLAPGQSVFAVRNRAAFSARYGNGLAVAGEYLGALDNTGETIRLEDATGEKILEFAYDNNWYPATDGLGASLLIVDELGSWETWGMKESWRASSASTGVFPTIDSMAKDDLGFRISINTVNGVTYQLEYKDDLTDFSWSPIPPSALGDGNTLLLVDTNAPPLKRFYRIHAQ